MCAVRHALRRKRTCACAEAIEAATVDADGCEIPERRVARSGHRRRHGCGSISEAREIKKDGYILLTDFSISLSPVVSYM